MAAPWIATGIIGIFTVAILMYCGKLLGGTRLALITGILAATSPQLVIHSLLLANPTFVIISASLLLLSFILLYQTKKIHYAFFMGVSIGVGISMHYQALNLLLFLPTVFFVPQTMVKKKIILFLTTCAGLLIPSFPLLYWDNNQQFANIRNILDYFLIAQYRLYVPNSWKLFLIDYLPMHWAFMIGGYKAVGAIVAFITGTVFLIISSRKNISRTTFILGLVLAAFLLSNRYYKGERTEGYMLYLLPFILLLSAWMLNILIQPKIVFEVLKIHAKRVFYTPIIYCFIGVILIGNLLVVKELKNYKGHVDEVENIVQLLIVKYPNHKFYLYDYEGKSFSSISSIIVFLEYQSKIDKTGIPIGFIHDGELSKFSRGIPVVLSWKNYKLLDLKNELAVREYSSQWKAMNQAVIYDHLIGWSKKHELRSPFSLMQYIKDKNQCHCILANTNA